MRKQYIRLEEMKKLFTMIPLLKDIKLSRKIELKKMMEYTTDEESDYIEAFAFNHGLSDMPHSNTNNISDPTENAASLYQQQINNEIDESKKAIKEITREIYYIEIVLEKIEAGLNSLNKVQREVLELRYWQNRTWKEIADCLKQNNTYYGMWQIQNTVAKKAMEKVKTIAVIDSEMYENVKLLVEREEK